MDWGTYDLFLDWVDLVWTPEHEFAEALADECGRGLAWSALCQTLTGDFRDLTIFLLVYPPGILFRYLHRVDAVDMSHP